MFLFEVDFALKIRNNVCLLFLELKLNTKQGTAKVIHKMYKENTERRNEEKMKAEVEENIFEIRVIRF